MANIKVRAKTGLYEYRRVVPERLRGHLPPVPGFPDKPNRIEFTKSLSTRSVREANKAAAELDALVDAAFTEAERRAVDIVQSGARRETVGGNAPAHPVVDPQQAFLAIDRWGERQIRDARLRHFNAAIPEDQFGTDAHTRSELAYALTQPKPWERIEHFDRALVAALASEKIDIGLDHPAIARLRPSFAVAWRTMIAPERRFRAGDWGEDDTPETSAIIPPPLPPPSDRHSGANSKKKTLAAAADDYLSDTPMRPETARDVRTLVKRLTEVVGSDRLIGSIGMDDIREFRELAKHLPSRPTQLQQAMSLRNLAEANKAAPTSTKLTQRTLNKWFDLLSALFEHAVRNRETDHNPVRGLKISKKKMPKEATRIPFSDTELAAFFASPLFSGSRSLKQRHLHGNEIIKDAAYWVALVCLYSGARINEIGQTHINDLRVHATEDGRTIHYLMITTQSDDESAADKSVKNDQSVRPVPLHPVILQLGFIQYAGVIRKKGERYLFPDLDHNKPWKPTKNLSRWYGRYLSRIGIENEKVTFHSLRHNFKDACRRSKVLKELHDRLTGHTTTGASDAYGWGPGVEALHEAVQTIRYPAIVAHQDLP